MQVHANVMIKNEEYLLQHVVPIWKNYQIDKWVFYDDNSSDNTVALIKDVFGDKAIIFNDKLPKFHEAYHRSKMLEYSRSQEADFVIAMDADELLSSNFVKNFNKVLEGNKKFDIQYYWYNVVDALQNYRQDPMYRRNYRRFVLPLKNTGKFDMSQYKYHTPRTPDVALPKINIDKVGFIHLQSINKKFYALKQLWYKHYEYKEYGHSVDYINQRYDPVVNNLQFDEISTPKEIIDGIKFDSKVYDKILDHKQYREYIEDNKVDELITFGREYL
jgi:hypothetical protein